MHAPDAPPLLAIWLSSFVCAAQLLCMPKVIVTLGAATVLSQTISVSLVRDQYCLELRSLFAGWLSDTTAQTRCGLA